jgi:hypothetical protein
LHQLLHRSRFDHWRDLADAANSIDEFHCRYGGCPTPSGLGHGAVTTGQA